MFLCVGLCLVLFTVVYCEDGTEKPHIIMIIPDDVGWNDVGFHGSNQIPTPNIDALAYNGIIMNKFYTQHICTPSRTALMTGNYPIRSGMQGYPIRGGENRSLPFDMPTLPQRMKELGYRTHLVGKWHLGSAYAKSTPNGKGFDYFYGYWNGLISYIDYSAQFGHIAGDIGIDLHENDQNAQDFEGKYATDLFTEHTLDIIEKHSGDKPLFLVLSHLAAHTGNEESGNALTTPDLEETNKNFGYVKNPRRRNYTDIMYQLDKSVGSVVTKLSDKNMLTNSIIVYFHDNGAQTSGGLHENFGSNWPLRGQKFSLFEGGVRGTCVIYSPLIKKSGYINNQLMHISDWLPTLYAAAGGNPENLGPIDGINLWNNIVSDAPSNRTETLLNIDEVLNYSSLIGYSGKYKLVNGSYPNGIYDFYTGEDGRGAENPEYNPQDILQSPANLVINKLRIEKLTQEKILDLRQQLDISSCRSANFTPEIDCNKTMCLFELLEDPCETKNILAEQPDVVDELSKKLQNYYKELMPQIIMPVDPNADPRLCDGHYFTWLEENGCPRNGSNKKKSYILAGTLVLTIILHIYIK